MESTRLDAGVCHNAAVISWMTFRTTGLNTLPSSGHDHEQDVFVLDVGSFYGFQQFQLRIVLAEEHPEITIDSEPGQAHATKKKQHY